MSQEQDSTSNYFLQVICNWRENAYLNKALKSKAIRKQGSPANAAQCLGCLPPELSKATTFLFPFYYHTSSLKSYSCVTLSPCVLIIQPSCTYSARHEWWYLSFISSVWKSVRWRDKTGLTLGCDEDQYFSLIIKNIGFLNPLISINLCENMNLRMEVSHYSFSR